MKWFTWPERLRLSLTGADVSGVVRRLRHAFLNELQVLSGWLQMGRPSSAMDCLERAHARLAADSVLAAMGDPDLETAVLLARARAEEAGLTFLVRVAGVPDPSYVHSGATGVGAEAAAAGSGVEVGRRAARARAARAVAVLALLTWLIERLSREGPGEIEVVLDPGGPGSGVTVGVPLPPHTLAGAEEKVLRAAGLRPLPDRLAAAPFAGGPEEGLIQAGPNQVPGGAGPDQVPGGAGPDQGPGGGAPAEVLGVEWVAPPGATGGASMVAEGAPGRSVLRIVFRRAIQSLGVGRALTAGVC